MVHTDNPESTFDSRLHLERDGERVTLVMSGDWTLNEGLASFEDSVSSSLAGVAQIGFDMGRLGEWDTTLISFLFDGYRSAQTREIEYQTDDLPSSVRRLLRLATAVPERDTGGDGAPRPLFDRVGDRALEARVQLTEQAAFVGEIGLSLGRLVTGRAAMRMRDFWLVLEEHGPQALPIVLLICFLVGLIIAFLGSVVLTQFGAGIYNAQLVGYGMLRELGALMTGIIMVGRSGAAFAAEIGSMKVSEELDAYKTLGVSPIDFIVLPRLLALVLMMPILTIFGDAVGVIGGMLVSALLMDISPTLFLGNLFGSVGVGDLGIGVLKGTVFGVLIAVSGCLRGMQSGRSADAVGKATTSAVVTGITLIIVANALIDWLATLL